MKYLMVALLLIGVSHPDYAAASKFDGEWKLASCNVSSGYLEDKNGFLTCQGASDPFVIDLWSSGSMICGEYESVAYGGNKVDDGYIVESSSTPQDKKGMENGTLDIDFFGGFSDDGKGHAKIKVVGKKLYWIVENSDGEFYLADKAVLRRSKSTFNNDKSKCPPADLLELEKYESRKQLLEKK